MAQNLQRTLCNISSFPKSSHPNRTTNQRSTSNLFMEKFRSRNSYTSHHLRMVERFSFDRDESFKIQKKSHLLPHAQSAEIQDQMAPVSASDDDEHSPKWWERDLGITLKDVHSTQELEEMIMEAEGKLVVVEFFASWCGSCRALYPKLCKLAIEHKDIVFAKVNFDESRPLCKSLKIKVLPYFHFYQGAVEQVDSFSCNLSKLQKLKDALAKYTV